MAVKDGRTDTPRNRTKKVSNVPSEILLKRAFCQFCQPFPVVLPPVLKTALRHTKATWQWRTDTPRNRTKKVFWNPIKNSLGSYQYSDKNKASSAAGPAAAAGPAGPAGPAAAGAGAAGLPDGKTRLKPIEKDEFSYFFLLLLLLPLLLLPLLFKRQFQKKKKK